MLDFESGPGGLMQLEFFVQAMQMRTGLWETCTLDALARIALPGDAVRLLAGSHIFLRQVETVLRRMDDTPVSRLPTDAVEQGRLARRCGLREAAALHARLRDARETIRRYAD